MSFVVDFSPGLHGPFPDRETANAWATTWATGHAEQGEITSWTIESLNVPAPVRQEARDDST